MSTSRKILVVDDDPVVGKSFDRVLSGKGYAVITAQNGEEALHKLANENYDAVFTDIKMPGMSGIEVAQKIKAAKPWLPVVIVTGYSTDAYRAAAEAAGVSGFLQKPLSPEMIAGSAEKAMHEADATPAPAATMPQLAEAADVTAAGDAQPASRAKNIALFLAAPFIGLVYVMAMPFVAAGMLAWFAAKALAAKVPADVKKFAMLIGGPLLGLGFILALPLVGIGALGYYAVKSARKE